MKKPGVYCRSWWCWGWLLLGLFPSTGVVFGYDSPDGGSIVFTAESNDRQHRSSTPPPTNGNMEQEGSPVMGGEVKRPPDIGAAGTASSTPPVRTESPTDEPAIFPDVSPVPAPSSNTESSPAVGGQPLGQPDPHKKRKEIKELLQ